MIIVFQVIQVVGIIGGLVLIGIGYRFRKAEDASIKRDQPWNRAGFNPLSPFSLISRKEMWNPPGFSIHLTGVILFTIGIISGVGTTIAGWLR